MSNCPNGGLAAVVGRLFCVYFSHSGRKGCSRPRGDIGWRVSGKKKVHSRPWEATNVQSAHRVDRDVMCCRRDGKRARAGSAQAILQGGWDVVQPHQLAAERAAVLGE